MILKVVWRQQSSSAQRIATGDLYPSSLGQAAGPLPSRDHKPEHPRQDCSLRPATALTHASHGSKQAKRRCLPRPALAAAIRPGHHLLRGWGIWAPALCPGRGRSWARVSRTRPRQTAELRSTTPVCLHAAASHAAGPHAASRTPNPGLHRSGWCKHVKDETCWALSLVLSVAYLEPRLPQHLRQTIQNTSFS